MAETIVSSGATRQNAAGVATRLAEVVHRLEAEATSRVSKRKPLEERWIEDLEQYHGRYDEATLKALEQRDQSKLFIGLTRPKTDAMSARLMDLLFPTDDRNWGIAPTPVPMLNAQAEKAARAAQALSERAGKASDQAGVTEGQEIPPDVEAMQAEADAAKMAAQRLQAEIDEAKARAELMGDEIDDQLKESGYHAVMRDIIEDGCKVGTGVCKGPVTGDRVRMGWKKQPVRDAYGQVRTEYALDMGQGDTPAMRYVDIWSYFPDMDARTPEDGEGTFERHLMNAKQLRKLARLPGFDADAVRRLLQRKPTTHEPAYMTSLRNINATTTQTSNEVYHVWEYSGPLQADDMRDIALAVQDADTLADLEEADPLTEMNAIVWFCQGELLKFAIYPFDSGECMYSVFNLAKDEASIFGYGIPAIMRAPQKALNASFRTMMDNAGLAAGPQIVVARQYVEPADGQWTFGPRKIWITKEGIPRDHSAFATFDIPIRQVELANIIAIAKQFIDDMTAMPSVAQGEQGVNPVRTYGGQVLQMNSSNVVFRRIVKNFDDDVTVKNIRRMYDWNMQFNPKEEIKGDYDIDARGSSVLLVKEQQTQAMMWVAANLGAHPVYGPMLKNRAVLRKMFQSMLIPSAEVVLSDDEIDAVLTQSAAQSAEKSAEQQKMEFEQQKMAAEIELANMENATRLQVAQIGYEQSLVELAMKREIEMDKLEAMLSKAREEFAFKAANDAQERASKERLAMTDAALTTAFGRNVDLT